MYITTIFPAIITMTTIMSIIITTIIMIITIMTTTIITTIMNAPVPARAALPSASIPPWKS